MQAKERTLPALDSLLRHNNEQAAASKENPGDAWCALHSCSLVAQCFAAPSRQMTLGASSQQKLFRFFSQAYINCSDAFYVVNFAPGMCGDKRGIRSARRTVHHSAAVGEARPSLVVAGAAPADGPL